jgi:pimeloyl-ACP methyl ester carboxylesterase
MTLGRIGGVLLVAGGAAILLAFGLGSSALGVGAIALVGLGAATLALPGPWPLGGRLARAGLGLSAVGLAGFMVSGLAIDYLHPSIPLLDLSVIAAVLVSVVATGVGGLLIGASAVRTIWGVRRTSETSRGEPELAPSGAEGPGQGSGRRVRRIRRGVVALLASTTLVGLTGYTAYVGAIGSDQLLRPSGNPDCRTPRVRYGWTYEAVNYDIAADAVLQSQNPDMEHCASQGSTAGSEVVTADGIRIAGWYVPAADGAGPTGTTVILVHGWGANKSEVLKYAVPLHATFNVVALDERDGGRSGQADSTFGLREKLDVKAVIDWLVRTKHPAHIAVMGNSMGGGAATLAAAEDMRIEALILDSTHAHVSNILERRLEVDAGHPSLPGTPAILAGIWVRTGIDLMEADPIAAIPALGHRPLLLIHGAADVHDLPALSVDANHRTAQDSGVPVEVYMCPGATHGKVIDTCPTEWGQWIVGFLDRVFQMPT